MTIQAGNLRHLIELQENNPTTDAAGQKIANWTTYATVWGRIKPRKGREFINAQQLKTSETTHEIEIRYHPLLTTKHRMFVDRSRDFEIDSILNMDEREIKQLVMAKEIV